MLSQYSWWDLIKVVLVVLVVYYAYVLIKYYREDIREWITSRGEKADPKAALPDEQEEDSPSLFAVNHYTPTRPPVADNSPAPHTQPAPPPEPVSQSQPAPQPQLPVMPSGDVDLNGVAVDENLPETTGFGLPISVEPVRPAEQSLTTLINAAQRLQADGEGVLTADDPTDAVASNLAEIINQQQGRSALAGIAFNR